MKSHIVGGGKDKKNIFVNGKGRNSSGVRRPRQANVKNTIGVYSGSKKKRTMSMRRSGDATKGGEESAEKYLSAKAYTGEKGYAH